ncbi:MAG: RNA-binding S4 domain-containing protein [Paludibacteraceae bacterium]|nr:RNA-binding S4 domain-containing protein [Paludibacteraceae bacterium]
MANEERIDKYLFAMRIYKTRSIAADACKKGRVKMNGTDMKPAKTFKIGDIFTVRKGPITYSYKVLQLSENRLGAKLVPEYMQDITAPEQLEILELARLGATQGVRDRGAGRPTKKDRRDIDVFISDDYDFNLDDIDDDEEI